MKLKHLLAASHFSEFNKIEQTAASHFSEFNKIEQTAASHFSELNKISIQDLSINQFK